MNRAIAWFTSNHVAANLLMIFFVLGGILTALSMKVEVFPEASLDKIAITVEYPGASPAEVEEAVVRRIEEKVAGIAGIRRIDSVAREGLASITIEVMQGWDLSKLTDEVKSEVDRITTLPEEAEKPIVRELTRRVRVLWVAIYGDAPEHTLKYLAEKAQDDITNLPGVTLAELFGVRKGEISIEIPEHTLRRYGISLPQVAAAVRKAGLDLPAGRIKTGHSEILLRTKGRRYHAADYTDIPILTRPDGSLLTLGEIATLKDTFEDTDLFARYDGKPAALIQIYRVADQNALTVAATVKRYVQRLKATLPAGVKVGLFGDRTISLKSRINLLLRNMGMGLILVSVLLAMVMELRLAFWVTLGIPVSFCTALWFLPHFDISINMISLFAFILVLGIVVDDAIVVGESVFKRREAGMPALKAAVEGAQEVAGPVVFSVLTTVAAFAPLLMGSGVMGKFMRNIPMVVILVLMGSLMESLFVLPAHLARSKLKKAGGHTRRTVVWLRRLVEGPYRRAVTWCLRWRYLTLAAGLALLLVTLGTITGGWLKFTLFPKVESDLIIAQVTMAAGTPVERTTQVAVRLEKAAHQAMKAEDRTRPKGSPPLLKYTVSMVGTQVATAGPHSGAPQQGSHVAAVFAQLLEGERRDRRAEYLADLWRKKTGVVPDAQSITFQSVLFSPGTPIEVHLSDPDLHDLLAAARELKRDLRQYPGVSDVADSFLEGKKELRIRLKPSGRTLGLTLDDISRQVRAAFYGAEALRLQRGKDEVKVMVRYPGRQRRTLENVERMRIRTPDGREVPFLQVAEVSLTRGYATIEHSQRRRVIKVTADVDETKINANEVRQHLKKVVLPALVRRHPDLRYNLEGAAREQRESLADVRKGFLLALFGIYVLLAIPFRSFTQPLIVMSAIPFGIVGAVWGHLAMGLQLSLLSLFGIVGLSGVVVNDSLLLIHTANRLREQGEGSFAAVVQAGMRRFRPILLTSLTTFAGLIPIISEKSLQAQFLIPMAVSLGFGVLFATGITLLLIPCGYLVLEDLHNLAERLKARLTRS